MVKGRAFLSVVAVLGVLSGCADDPPPLSSIDAFCDGACTGVVRCSGGQWNACYESCRTDPRNRGLASIRPEAAAVVDACLPELECATLSNGPLTACWDRAREETAPSQHLRAFCPGYSTALFECGYWLSVEDCETHFNIWTDGFLDQLTTCTRAATCEETDACLEARFGST